jgi:hypothetical protein
LNIAPLPVYSKEAARNIQMKMTDGWILELDPKDDSR